MMEGMEQPNQEKIRTPGEKEMYGYLGILEADTIKQVGDERKKKKISPEKTTQNQTK